MINKRPGWTLVDIYADEGISGTSLQHRDAFKRLMRDCDARKVDMIITKSVSRFARNIVDCIDNARHLRALNPPIGIFFETESIYTLKEDYEMSLALISICPKAFLIIMLQHTSFNKLLRQVFIQIFFIARSNILKNIVSWNVRSNQKPAFP